MKTIQLGSLNIWTVAAEGTKAVSALARIQKTGGGFLLAQNTERCLAEIEDKDGVSIARQAPSLHASFEAAVAAARGMQA